MSFLAQNKDKFDLIVWNLSGPSHGPAIKLYNLFFFQMISRALSKNGIFLFESLKLDFLNCLLGKVFPYTYLYPSNSLGLGSVALSSGQAQIGYGRKWENPNNCDQIKVPTLANPFVFPMGQTYIYNKLGDLSESAISEPGLFVVNKVKIASAISQKKGTVILNTTPLGYLDRDRLYKYLSSIPTSLQPIYILNENLDEFELSVFASAYNKVVILEKSKVETYMSKNPNTLKLADQTEATIQWIESSISHFK